MFDIARIIIFCNLFANTHKWRERERKSKQHVACTWICVVERAHRQPYYRLRFIHSDNSFACHFSTFRCRCCVCCRFCVNFIRRFWLSIVVVLLNLSNHFSPDQCYTYQWSDNIDLARWYNCTWHNPIACCPSSVCQFEQRFFFKFNSFTGNFCREIVAREYDRITKRPNPFGAKRQSNWTKYGKDGIKYWPKVTGKRSIAIVASDTIDSVDSSHQFIHLHLVRSQRVEDEIIGTKL